MVKLKGTKKKRRDLFVGSSTDEGGEGSEPVNAGSAMNWANNWRHLKTN